MRAETLLNLYETRGKFEQQENSPLLRARAKVEEVMERYNKIEESIKQGRTR
jgi:hypothetical protein